MSECAKTYKYPKNEIVWVHHYNGKHELCFITTSKFDRSVYYLYECVGDTFQRLGKSPSPKTLEEKFAGRMRGAGIGG